VFQLSRPPIPKADYRFANTLATSVGSAPALTDIGGAGTNTYATATVDGTSRRVRRFPQGRGVRLAPTTGMITNNGTYTVSMLFKPTATGGWRRLIDTTNGTSENGLYINPDGRLDYYPVLSGSTVLNANVWHHVVLVRNAATNTVAVFVNGIKQFSVATQGNGVVTPADGLRFFVDDSGEETGGDIARIRVYNTALTDNDVKFLDRLPVSGPPLPTAVSPTSVARGATGVTFTITGTNFTPNAAVSLSDGIVVKSVKYVSSTKLTVKADVRPTAATGLRPVVVATDLGSSSCTTCLTVT
jgi:hypothetical protein